MAVSANFFDIGILNPLILKAPLEFKNKNSTYFTIKGRKPLISGKARASTSSANSLTQNNDLPPILRKDKRKPLIAPPRRVPTKGLKKPPLEDSRSPPGNGLLVEEMVPLAHTVFEARETLLQLVAMLMDVVPVKACRSCDHSHVGPIGHDLATCEGRGSSDRHGRHDWIDGCVFDVVSNLDAYHSYDRLTLIRHDDRRGLKRLSAVVELCIQAGLDLPEYPVVRRTEPSRGTGRVKVDIDDMYFEMPAEFDFLLKDAFTGNASSKAPSPALAMRERCSDGSELHNDGKINSGWKFEELFKDGEEDITPLQRFEKNKKIAEMALRLWEVMRSGAERLMSRYTVRACGYCPEVHIGPRGHLVKLCGAFKHQWRQGQHGWQVAGLDDLIPLKYVWHVPDLEKPLLSNELRNFYGQAPAVVELCAQAGVKIPDKYRPMMRLDVVAPTFYEAGNAV